MSLDTNPASLAPTIVKGCLVVSLPADLAGEIESLRDVVLEGVRGRRAHSVILDFSGLQLLDSGEFAQLRATLNMAALLGARAVLCGLRPGVVAYLVQNDIDTQGLVFMRDLDEALSASFEAVTETPTDDPPLEEDAEAMPDSPAEGEPT